jgi:hypothetical protein
VPNWKRIAELTDEQRGFARDAKAVMLGAIREGREPSKEEVRRLCELHGAASRLEDELERAFYAQSSGT